MEYVIVAPLLFWNEFQKIAFSISESSAASALAVTAP